MSRSSLVVLSSLLALAACGRPDMSLRAPGKIERALTVVGDLGAVATLVKSGGAALDPAPLTRGDDGVTFSGFVQAEPGQYTLEIVFDGVPAGASARHFLGRLTSDSFTVTQGEAVTPNFSKPVDTLGRDGDGADEDEDGLGFLDELLLGTDPESSDSDADGILDGVDCVPNDADDAFAIVAGGSFDDCDADGFRSLTPPFGEEGNDCNDSDANVNPSIDDDCANNVDEDCNPQTCPIADFDGPEVEIVSPADGAVIGCNVPFVVEATDPSDVTNVFMTAPDHPIAGGTARTVAFVSDGDDLKWRAANGFGFTGGGLDSGPLPVVVTAIDTAANQNTSEAQFTLLSQFPEISMTGPDTIVDGPPVDVTVTPAPGGRTLALLELRASPYNPATFQLDTANEEVLGSLPVTGGTIAVNPDALSGDFVVYPVAVDDIGNTAAPLFLGASFNTVLGVNAGFFCDGQTHYVPAIARRGDIEGPVTLLAHLQEAIDIATAAEPNAFLTQVIGFGVDANGLVDLSRTDDFSVFVAYKFMTPEAIQQFGDNAESISVTWYGAAFATQSPVVDPDGSFILDEIQNPDALLDSDVVAAQYTCGGNGLQGSDSDFMMYMRDVDGAIPGTDEVTIFTADGYSWTTDATNLSDPDGFCCTPDGCS